MADPRVAHIGGDLLDLASSRQLPPAGTNLVFHLAAVVSGECEADFELGMRSNLDSTRALLDSCRALGVAPTFVFASSLAVFGNVPGQPIDIGPERRPGRRLVRGQFHQSRAADPASSW